MRFIQICYIIVIILMVVSGCSGAANQSRSKDEVQEVSLARVAGTYITLAELFQNPGVRHTLDTNIKTAIIAHEFKKRGLPKPDDLELWNKYVEVRFQGDEENALQQLSNQGLTREFALKNIRMEYHMEQIFLDENPISMDEVREEFNKNPRGHQRFFKSYAPEEKADDPESITFEDIQEPFFENYKRRRMSAEGPAFLDELIQQYINQGLVENYTLDDKYQGLTKIEPEKPIQEMDPSQVQPAPVHKPESGAQRQTQPPATAEPSEQTEEQDDASERESENTDEAISEDNDTDQMESSD